MSIISSSLRAGTGDERRPSGLRMVRLFAAALIAATLAACAQQPPVMTGTGAGRQAAVQPAPFNFLAIDAGYTDLANVRGGFGGSHDPSEPPVAGWRDSGLPVETGPTGRLE